ncbi:hypothetical protein [Lichenibacterium dinghuense]|uniref:hypothetical protein n=1 Tax=Lichenibacterium dinghuense TaxID=2895977 RepID=UPI001F19040D|nr:hypothetical protein [Lichenibacterium sp. 6Y81]
MSATEIARLQYAAGKLHVDPAAVGGAISSWSSKMVEFRMHTSDFYRYLMRQNADVAAKISADNPVDALKDSLDYLSRIKDPQIQKRVADMAGLGDLMPMLGKGPQGLADAFADAAREVKPISQALVDAAEKLNDSTNRMNQSWTNLKNDVGPSFIDPLSKMIDKLDATLKFAAANPGDAAAVVGVGAVAAGTLYARHRLMRNSSTFGASGLDRAAGELTGAAGALKQAAAALEGGRGGPSGGAGPGGSSPGFANLLPAATLAGLQLFDLARGAPDELRKLQENPDKDPASPEMEFAAKLGDTVRGWFKGESLPSASDRWATPSRYDVEARARGGDLKKDVQEGAKAGIVQGLRELAQQQELGGGPGGNSFGGTPSGRGGSAGMPNLRYGRPKAGGGYRRGPGVDGGGPEGAFNPRQPEKPGTYRPEYKLSDADLSDYVVNTVNGEATSSAESIDAVINNMMNRVGSKGWGPSANLRDVASAPGQYAGHRPASAQVAERIRARIRAIASGGVPDNTNGSNAYRAAWYHGKWYQQHAATGRVVGGNRFDYEPWTKNGPYAPYPSAHAPAPATPGAGTPAPSAAAVSDAERFKAQQRLINGSHDPADRALVERYKAQQAKPEHHRAGGWLRGRGTGTSDSIPAMLSNGEYVVQAKAAGAWLPLLHAINSGQLARFAEGGPVGFGVAKAFYPGPKEQSGISDAEGHANRRFWRDFMRKPRADGGMGASWRTTIAALAMMQGESGRGLNSKLYGWDVNGPSGGVDQLHDVTTGRSAHPLRRLSDLMRLGMMQHADWRDPWIQAANCKREALGDMNFAWRRMAAARSTGAALKEGIDKFENPAQHDLELRRRMPNVLRLQREVVADRAAPAQAMDPLEVNIRHHPHTGHPIVTARAGKGVKLNIRSFPTMRPT